MVRRSVFPCVYHLNACDQQGTCPTLQLQTYPTRRRGVYQQRLFSLVVLRWVPVRREAIRCRRPSHFQPVGGWTDFQDPASVAWSSFHGQRSRNPSSSSTIDIPCSVRSPCSVFFLKYLRRMFQDIGTRFQHIVPTHRKSRRCSCNQVSDSSGRHPTGGKLRKICERPLRLVGHIRP